MPPLNDGDVLDILLVSVVVVTIGDEVPPQGIPIRIGMVLEQAPVRRGHIRRKPVEIGHVSVVILGLIQARRQIVGFQLRIIVVKLANLNFLAILDDGPTGDMEIYANAPRRVQSQLLAGNGEGALVQVLGEEGPGNGAAQQCAI